MDKKEKTKFIIDNFGIVVWNNIGSIAQMHIIQRQIEIADLKKDVNKWESQSKRWEELFDESDDKVDELKKKLNDLTK